MQGISTFSWYPRGVYGLQNLGPSIANGFITAGLPTRVINGPGARKVTKPVGNVFEFNPNTIKDSVGFKVSEPEKIIHPNLKPSVNFSLPTSTKSLNALNLKEDINQDTESLEGGDLLGKLVTYVSDLYKSGSSPFELSASPFQSLVNACKRLNLNSDPTLAGLPKTVDNRMPFGTFIKVNIWLMGADQVFDKSLKPGYIYIAQQKVPVSQLVSQNRPKTYVLDLFNRRASIGVANASMADIAEGPRLPDVGHMPLGGANLADGRDGRQEVASQNPVKPDREEVKELLDVTARAVNDAADLDAALLAIERPESLRYSRPPVVIPVVPGLVEADAPLAPSERELVSDLPELPRPPGGTPFIRLKQIQSSGYTGFFPRITKQLRGDVYREIWTNRDSFQPVFDKYIARTPDRDEIQSLLNERHPLTGQRTFPATAYLAEEFTEQYQGGYKNFIEMLMYIMRNDPTGDSAIDQQWESMNLRGIKKAAYQDLNVQRAALRQLRQAVLKNDRALAQKAIADVLHEENDDDGNILRFLNTRGNLLTPIAVAQTLLTLNNTQGQIGVGKKRKSKKGRARNKPY